MHRLQEYNTNSTCLATTNETIYSTEAPLSDIAMQQEIQSGH